MSTEQILTITCDICKKEIKKDEYYINASSYGMDAHKNCILDISFIDTIKFLGLDDIKVMKNLDWATAIKITNFGSTELVRNYIKPTDCEL